MSSLVKGLRPSAPGPAPWSTQEALPPVSSFPQVRRAEAAVSSSQSSEHKLLLRPHFRSCILNSLLLPNLGTLCPPSGSLPRLAGPGRVLHGPSAPVPSTGTPPSRRVFPGQTRFLSEPWEPTELRHLHRYEEEINRRTAAENEFVLLKKVRGGGPVRAAWSRVRSPPCALLSGERAGSETGARRQGAAVRSTQERDYKGREDGGLPELMWLGLSTVQSHGDDTQRFPRSLGSAHAPQG